MHDDYLAFLEPRLLEISARAEADRLAVFPCRLSRGALLQGAARHDLWPCLFPERDHLGLRLRRVARGGAGRPSTTTSWSTSRTRGATTSIPRRSSASRTWRPAWSAPRRQRVANAQPACGGTRSCRPVARSGPATRPRSHWASRVASSSTSSPPGGVVADFFAGSGTVGAAALEADRQFLLVDSSSEAVQVMQRRFAGAPGIEYRGLRAIEHRCRSSHPYLRPTYDDRWVRSIDPSPRRCAACHDRINADQRLCQTRSGWRCSPFAWIKNQSSRGVGAVRSSSSLVGVRQGIRCHRTGDSDADRVINGKRVESQVLHASGRRGSTSSSRFGMQCYGLRSCSSASRRSPPRCSVSSEVGDDGRLAQSWTEISSSGGQGGRDTRSLRFLELTRRRRVGSVWWHSSLPHTSNFFNG